MSYTVSGQSIPVDTSTGKAMGNGTKVSGTRAGYLAAPGGTGYVQVSAGATGPATGPGKGGTVTDGAGPVMSGGINKPPTVAVIGKMMGNGTKVKGTRGGFL